MAYAGVEDVQGRIPRQLCEIGPESQPSLPEVEGWLEQLSGWIDSGLRWKYVTPVTAEPDLEVLRPIAADLAAARVWGVLAGHSEEYGRVGERLERFAKELLCWNRSTGRMLLVLPGSALAEDGEAAVARPAGTFTDPDAGGSEPRLFGIGMKL
jgi:hypothetical protein